MKNVLEYKGYFTRVEYSTEDRVLHGRIEGIQDLVNFECDQVDQVEEQFHEAVDDYLAYCEDLGKQPEKPYRGVFNIRISPELHRRAVVEAAKEGITLNRFVATAVEAQLASV